MFEIGKISLDNNVFLAPMSGVTDTPFRKTAMACGAGMVVSEMVASEELARARPDVVLRATNANVTPFVIQLAGREAHWMAEGAKIAQDRGADIIDINMGCPARQVTGALSGSALMRNAEHALSLVKAVVDAVSVPVTLKMRLGWDHDSLNAPEIAKGAEEIGVKMITVHGRTRQQFYKGAADWQRVNDTVRALTLPVTVNGDILCAASAKEALNQSAARAVMVGRAAEGQPWILGEIASVLRGQEPTKLSFDQKFQIAKTHYLDTIEHYKIGHNAGEEMGLALGIRMARKHLASYIEKLDREMEPQLRRQLKARVCTLNDPAIVVDRLEAVFLASLGELQKLAA